SSSNPSALTKTGYLNLRRRPFKPASGPRFAFARPLKPEASSRRRCFEAVREREKPMQGSGSLRPIVIPGEAVGGPGLKPGPGTYGEGGRLFAAQLGIRDEHDGLVSVIPLNGRYLPRRGDAVIGGIPVEVSPARVPRVIGKQASMVSLIKDLTRCQIYVGQNGRIWLDGDDRSTALAAMAIRLIEDRAQASGLTEAVRELIEKE